LQQSKGCRQARHQAVIHEYRLVYSMLVYECVRLVEQFRPVARKSLAFEPHTPQGLGGFFSANEMG
jgi:hypothetical protein